MGTREEEFNKLKERQTANEDEQLAISMAFDEFRIGIQIDMAEHFGVKPSELTSLPLRTIVKMLDTIEG